MISAFSAYILAGGFSTRFGSDKARAMLDGKPLLVRMAEQARAHGASGFFAVAREAGAYDDLGVKTITDLRAGLGPVAGLESALLHAGDGWILLLTCDQLVCEKAWVGKLREAQDEKARVFHDGERFQPVPGLYHTSFLPAVFLALNAAQAGGPRASFQRLLGVPDLLPGVCRVPLPADWPLKLQANTRGDLASAQRADIE